MDIIAILLSPLIAVLVTIWLNNRVEKRKDRLDIFKTLMMCREHNSNMDFVKAVNSIDVVFYDRDNVREAWKKLNESYHEQNPDLQKIEKNHTKLLEVMAVDLGYKDKITWDTITSSYFPIWLSTERLNEAKYKEMQMQLMKATVAKSQAGTVQKSQS